MSAGGGGAEELSEALLSFCESSTLSLEGMREIIDHYGETPNNNSEDINITFFMKACENEAVDESIIQCLLEYFPRAIDAVDEKGFTPLHAACKNKNVTLGVIKRLIAASENVNNLGQSPLLRRTIEKGNVPLHVICGSENVNEKTAMEILMLLIEKCPESIRQVNNRGFLPIHLGIACGRRSPQFCQVLMKSYPDSVRVRDGKKHLPLHLACFRNTLPTVEYLYNLYPDAVHQTAQDGCYPIHRAMFNKNRENGDTKSALEIIRFLLDCDPLVKLQKFRGVSLLISTCDKRIKIEAAMQIVEAVYDAHPEAIEEDRLFSNIDIFGQRARAFINGELVHARLANDYSQMTSPDENGQLSLHHAMRNNVRLGSIKLLVKGYPSAIRHSDSNGALPLHVACQYHDSPSVVQYLADLDPITLKEVDNAGNIALHYACREAKYGLIGMLLENYDNVSVSKRNESGKVPIEVLFDEVHDRESVEYIDCVFRLLTAHPLPLMSFVSQPADLSADEVAIVFSYLPPKEIMRARVCITWRDAAKKTLVPRTKFQVESVRSYNAVRAMSTALPNLQQVSIRNLSQRHKYADGENPDQDQAAQTATYATHDLNIISNFRKLRVLDINDFHSKWCGGSLNSLNGRYPVLFNFPMLESLTLEYCQFLEWDLDMLSGFPLLRELWLSGQPGLTGDLKSFRVFKNTLEKIYIDDCHNIHGNFMELADFPCLRDLCIFDCPVTGDIRLIHEDDFPSLEELLLPSTVIGGYGYQFQRISDVPSFMQTIHPLLKRFPGTFNYRSVDDIWRLSDESDDWYQTESHSFCEPPFEIHPVIAGSRCGWRWVSFDQRSLQMSACEVNWLDPEPSQDSDGYEKYVECMQRIEDEIDFYRGYYEPPTEEEYRRLSLRERED